MRNWRRGARLAAGWVLSVAVLTVAVEPAGAVTGGSPASGVGFVVKVQVGDARACTGALVDPLWIVTASGCLGLDGKTPPDGAPPAATTATIGRMDLSTGDGSVVPVVDLRSQPQRGVTLARLAWPVPGTLPVPVSGAKPTVGGAVRVVGFGRTATEWVPNVLRSASFTVATIGADRLDLSGQDGTATLCKGDAGAVVLRDGGGGPELAGLAVASGQGGCLAEVQAPSTATVARVDDLSGWITQVLGRGYLLYNVVTGKCADLPQYGPGQAGGGVFQYTCDGSTTDNQLWTVDLKGRTGDGQPLYLVRNVKDNLCLDVPDIGAVPPGTAVSEYYCGGAEDNQYFRMVPRPAGVWLVNDRSGLCLDVNGWGGNDARLTLFTCLDNDDHFWTLRDAAQQSPAPGPATDVNGAGIAEDYAYPGAAAIKQQQGIQLLRGNGRIMLAACDGGNDLFVVERLDGSARVDYCFRVLGRDGFVTLELPNVYLVRGGGLTVVATATYQGRSETVSVAPHTYEAIGGGNASHTLVELRSAA